MFCQKQANCMLQPFKRAFFSGLFMLCSVDVLYINNPPPSTNPKHLPMPHEFLFEMFVYIILFIMAAVIHQKMRIKFWRRAYLGTYSYEHTFHIIFGVGLQQWSDAIVCKYKYSRLQYTAGNFKLGSVDIVGHNTRGCQWKI